MLGLKPSGHSKIKKFVRGRGNPYKQLALNGDGNVLSSEIHKVFKYIFKRLKHSPVWSIFMDRTVSSNWVPFQVLSFSELNTPLQRDCLSFGQTTWSEWIPALEPTIRDDW